MSDLRATSDGRAAGLPRVVAASLTRTDFLRVAAGLATGTGSLAACAPGEQEANTRAPGDPRPILTWWADDVVHLAAPLTETPIAYVSMERRVVYVDQDFRDRASWLLSAHISVSTWHWRIPLPGDDPGVPITPGDEEREFEELTIREWDPSMSPAMDDIRIVRGRPVLRAVQLDCVPLSGVSPVRRRPSATGDALPVEAWVRGGPWDLILPAPSSADTMRQDFGIVGTASRFAGRSCTGSGEAVQILSWKGTDAG